MYERATGRFKYAPSLLALTSLPLPVFWFVVLCVLHHRGAHCVRHSHHRGVAAAAWRNGRGRVGFPAWVVGDWTCLSVSGYGSRWEGFRGAFRGCIWDEQTASQTTSQTRQDKTGQTRFP